MPNGAASALSSVVKLKALNGTVDITLLLLASAQLHSKFSENHFHVVDNMYRASQYDHKSNSYNKKKLSQRWHKFEDGTKVQRDIYSAFLLLCHNDDFKTINQDICISKYETFKKAHDKCISDIKTSGQKVCNSGI